ncbi:MAG TPA: energy transducer TonB, partial [Kofleriaceae bacterium]|nr:energy transducer TonB [Kofleriaceae bacterium]
MMRLAIFAGVLSYYAIAYVLIELSSPIVRLDAPVETSLAMIDVAGPPPRPARHDAYRTDVSPPYHEHAREIISCSIPNPWSRRISGEACVYPSEDDRQAMVHDGIERTAGVFKVCVSATATIDAVSPLRSTKYEGYDQRLVAAIRGWRFLPYRVDG